MKRSSRIALVASLAITAIAGTSIGLVVAPVVKEQNFIKSVVNDTINLFKDHISKIYRPTFHTRRIANFIKHHINSMGYVVYEDDYSVEGSVDYSGNVYWDIPSSDGCQTWPGITLQAHMDMICEVDPKQGHYDWSNGVDLVQEGNILHSRNYWTSIGADNGIGLSLLLSLTKHEKEFTHGPLRVIITADEEDGDSGASIITHDVIKYDNLINVDNEAFGPITKCCAGTFDAKYSTTLMWKDVDASAKQYLITVDGLKGGHSAIYIEKNPSAIKLANEVLTNMLKEANVELLSFISNNANNNISNKTSFAITTDLANIAAWISNQKTAFKQKYPNEKDLDITCVEIPSQAKYVKSLSNGNTGNVAKAIDNIFFGVKEYMTVQSKQYIQTSSNIGPLEINNNGNFNFHTLIRSIHHQNELELAQENVDALIQIYPQLKFTYSETPVWEYKKDVPLVDLLIKGFDRYNYSHSIDISHGWLECAFFAQAREEADIASFGFNIEHVHEPIECVHLDSVEPVFKVLLFTLQNITSK